MAGRVHPLASTGGEAGFSLIELMVVIFIIGLAAGAVVLTMAPPGGAAQVDAERFAARAAAARDLAIIERRPVRLWVSASGYGFEQRADGQWGPATSDILESRNWSDGVIVAISDTDRASRIFDQTGLPSLPLEIAFSKGDADASVTIEGSGNVRAE